MSARYHDDTAINKKKSRHPAIPSAALWIWVFQKLLFPKTFVRFFRLDLFIFCLQCPLLLRVLHNHPFFGLGGGGVVDNGPSLYITMVVATAAADSKTPTSFQGQGNKGYTAAAAAKAQGHRVRVVHGVMP